jgi:hypothetical protein
MEKCGLEVYILVPTDPLQLISDITYAHRFPAPRIRVLESFWLSCSEELSFGVIVTENVQTRKKCHREVTTRNQERSWTAAAGDLYRHPGADASWLTEPTHALCFFLLHAFTMQLMICALQWRSWSFILILGSWCFILSWRQLMLHTVQSVRLLLKQPKLMLSLGELMLHACAEAADAPCCHYDCKY